MSTGREEGRVLYKQGTYLHLGAAARQTLDRHIALERPQANHSLHR